MNETDEPCARLCGNCVNFKVLDDQPRDPCKWFGVCWMQIDDEFGIWATTKKLLGFAYDHGMHGDDACERPDEWFEEE
nr:MAG TPA: hypothetical protein [Caudoviricetes sp.]